MIVDLPRDRDSSRTTTTGDVHLRGIVQIVQVLHRGSILKAVQGLRFSSEVGLEDFSSIARATARGVVGRRPVRYGR
jgi:hypothetical protein